MKRGLAHTGPTSEARSPRGRASVVSARVWRWLWMAPLALAPLIDVDSVLASAKVGTSAEGYEAVLIAAWVVGVTAACVTVQVNLGAPRVPFDPTRSGLRGEWTAAGLAVIAVAAACPIVLFGGTSTTVSALWCGFVLVGVLAARAMAVRDQIAVGFAAAVVVLPTFFQWPAHDDVVVVLAIVGVAIAAALGSQVREQRRRVALARVAAVQGERVAMARELHDSVAHELTGILVLARANRSSTVSGASGGSFAQVPSPPTASSSAAPSAIRQDRSNEAFGLIEAAAERALDEIRTLVHAIGVEPSDTGDDDTAATGDVHAGTILDRHDLDGHRRLVALVEAFDAGTTATVDADLAPLHLTPSVWLVLHRVCAEALTNVRRHAGSAERVVVRLGRRGGTVDLEVVDDGCGDGGIGGGSGTGIAGARRRLAALGGGLDADRDDAGCWRLHAWLPLSAASATVVDSGAGSELQSGAERIGG